MVKIKSIIMFMLMFMTLTFSKEVLCIEKPLVQDIEGAENEWIAKCKRIKKEYIQRLYNKKTFTQINSYNIKNLEYYLMKINSFQIPVLINFQGVGKFNVMGKDVFMYFTSRNKAMAISLGSTNIFDDYWAKNRNKSKTGIKLTKKIYKGKLSGVLLRYDRYLYKPKDIKCSIKTKFQDVRIINALLYDFVVGNEHFKKVIDLKGKKFMGYMIIKKNDNLKKGLKRNYMIKVTLFDDEDTVIIKYTIYSKDIFKVYKYAYLIKKMISYK